MKKQPLKLSEGDQRYLTEMISKGQVQARKVRRATALLQLNQGSTIQAVAETLRVKDGIVSIWRNKYGESGLDCLPDQPRSGRPLGIDGEPRAKITALACAATPEGRGTWSLRLWAEKIVELEFCEKISHTQVGKILKKTNDRRIGRKRGVSER